MGVLGRHALERAGVRRVLDEDGRIRVVGDGTVGQASNLVRTARPDILVTIHSGTDEALSTLRAWRASSKDMVLIPPRIVLVSCLSQDSARMLLRLGAHGILLSSDSVEHLPWAVRATASGSVALAPSVARSVVDQYVRPSRLAEETAAARELMASLSPREREILQLVGDGVSNSGVAKALSISGHTVKDHIHAIYSKLGVDNRVQAARIAWQGRASSPTQADPASAQERSVSG